MRVLVTGSTGFIGSHLVEKLVLEHNVFALVRNPAKLAAFSFREKIRVVRGDLLASESFPEEIESVIHLAAITKAVTPSEFLQVNQHGVSRFLERLASQKHIRKVIQVSSMAAAGPSPGHRPLNEEDEPCPVSLYGKSKLLEEQVFREKSPAPLVILRAPIVFGPRDYDMLDALRLLNRGLLPVLSPGDRYYSIIYVHDLAEGIRTALTSPVQNELIYLTNPVPVDWNGFMQLTARLMGRERIRRVRVPYLAGRILAELSEWRCRILKRRAIFNRDKFCEMKHPRWVCSGEKAERLLHFTPPTDLEKALAETIHWYRGEGLL